MEKQVENRIEQLDKKLQEAGRKERQIKEFAKDTKSTVDDILLTLESIKSRQDREFGNLKKRVDQLSDWLKKDSEKLFD